MSERTSVTITLTGDSHKLLKRDASDFNDMKLQAMVCAYQRGWRMLTPEQQMQAIRCDQPEERVGSALADAAADPRHEGARLVCDAALVNEVLADALADGVITSKEKGKVRTVFKRMLRRVESTAAALTI